MPEGHSKVRTENDPRDGSPGRRVLWIDWDSGLRGSGLRVGDRITGDQGEPYGDEDVEEGRVLGGHAESRRWERLGLSAGDALSGVIRISEADLGAATPKTGAPSARTARRTRRKTASPTPGPPGTTSSATSPRRCSWAGTTPSATTPGG